MFEYSILAAAAFFAGMLNTVACAEPPGLRQSGGSHGNIVGFDLRRILQQRARQRAAGAVFPVEHARSHRDERAQERAFHCTLRSLGRGICSGRHRRMAAGVAHAATTIGGYVGAPVARALPAAAAMMIVIAVGAMMSTVFF